MAKVVEKQVAVEAEVRMLSGKKDPTSNLKQGERGPTSAAKAAESIGVSENTYRDMKLVAEKGSEEQIETRHQAARTANTTLKPPRTRQRPPVLTV